MKKKGKGKKKDAGVAIMGISNANLKRWSKTPIADPEEIGAAGRRSGPTFPGVLADLIVIIHRLSGVLVTDPTKKLKTIPNLVLEPNLRRSINRKWFPNGGGFPAGSLKGDWTVAFLARAILYKLTGE